MNVFAFHGQGSSPQRMRFDMGNPDWVTDYPDWRNGFNPGRQPFVALAYSLGGSYLAELTNYQVADRIRGIAVYESPVLGMLPAPVACPVCIIWNDYIPRQPKRREMKSRSIAEWSRAATGGSLTLLVGRYRKHTRWIPRWPLIGQAWDRGLNPQLHEWVRSCL